MILYVKENFFDELNVVKENGFTSFGEDFEVVSIH